GWPRALGFAVAGLGVIALLLTGSRGALLSLIVVLIWMARKRVPYTGRLLMAGVAFGTLLLMFYPPLQDRLLTLFSSNDASTSVRFDEYSHFPEAVAMFPFGIGFKVEPPVPGTGLWGISNLWLNFVYKLGVPGLLLFVAVIWSWWRETRPSRRTIRLTADNALWLGTTSGLMAALLSGIFDHYFSFTQVLIALFWLLLGLNLHEARRLKLKAASLSGVQP
ncbi:O-antigen ligase family protein, partial [Pseudomonas gingeri]